MLDQDGDAPIHKTVASMDMLDAVEALLGDWREREPSLNNHCKHVSLTRLL